MGVICNLIEKMARANCCSVRPMSCIPRLIFLSTVTLISCLVISPPLLGLSQSAPTWEELSGGGTTALDRGEYWIAEPMLKQAVIKAAGFGEADLRLAKSYGELGRLYTIRGRFDEAEPYLEEALFVKQQALGNQSEQIVPAMGSLIRFYLTYGTASKAYPLTEEVLSFVEGKLKEPTSMAQFKVTLQKGVPLQGWAGAAAPAMGNSAIEWAITCDDLGNLYRNQGNLDLAYRLFKAALDVKSTVLGKEHLSLANSYDNLGSLYLAKNDDAVAESFFQDALEISEKILPPESPEVYARLDKLAKCLIKLGKYKEAEKLYIRAQNFWRIEPSKYGDEARAAFALGCLYSDEKNYAAAAPVLRKALELSEQFNGPNSINLVPYLQKYAYVLYYLGARAEVDQLRLRAGIISGTN